MAYRDDFQSFRSDYYWTIPRILGMFFAGIVLLTILGLGSCALGLFSGAAHNAATVVQKEFYPDALLRKYEWFKDASAALDKKMADIGVYQTRLDELRNEYVGVSRGKWPRDDREQFAIWSSEAAGIKASYNQLVAEYNSEMVKFNWRFTNVGDVPQGGKPLPREYRTYLEK